MNRRKAEALTAKALKLIKAYNPPGWSQRELRQGRGELRLQQEEEQRMAEVEEEPYRREQEAQRRGFDQGIKALIKEVTRGVNGGKAVNLPRFHDSEMVPHGGVGEADPTLRVGIPFKQDGQWLTVVLSAYMLEYGHTYIVYGLYEGAPNKISKSDLWDRDMGKDEKARDILSFLDDLLKGD